MNKEKSIDFLAFSFMGVLTTDPKDKIIQKCCERAYLDFCRTIKDYVGNESETKEEAVLKNSRDEVTADLVKKIDDLIKSDITNQRQFDKRHRNICTQIIRTYYRNGAVLHYGQAQKWVNMAMKYLLIIDTIAERNFGIGRIKEYLHIPIDNYILVAVKSKSGSVSFGKYFDILNDGENRKLRYKGNHVNNKFSPFSWSKIPCYVIYRRFQDELRKAIIGEKPSELPIDWEDRMWIKIAKEKMKA